MQETEESKNNFSYFLDSSVFFFLHKSNSSRLEVMKEVISSERIRNDFFNSSLHFEKLTLSLKQVSFFATFLCLMGYGILT